MAFLGVVSWSLAVDTIRLLSICSFLVCSLTFTWYSFISLIAVLGELCMCVWCVLLIEPMRLLTHARECVCVYVRVCVHYA